MPREIDSPPPSPSYTRKFSRRASSGLVFSNLPGICLPYRGREGNIAKCLRALSLRKGESKAQRVKSVITEVETKGNYTNVNYFWLNGFL